MGVLVVVVLLLLTVRSGSGPLPEPPSAAVTSTSEPTRSPSPSPSPPPPPPRPSRTSPTLPDYTTTGRFSRMPGEGAIRGRSGQLMTYRVEVEQGAGVTSREFATVIDATLRHPRGWTAGGHWRFQRVADGEADLVIRLATPRTVDERCSPAGADTDGYTSCRAGRLILINLDRWYIGVPHVQDLTAYRQYLVNHEVGHGLGRGHESCPAAGWRAPVMLQQTLGLDGCAANAWPRGEDGLMISGPSTP